MWLEHNIFLLDLLLACFLTGAFQRPAPDVDFGGFMWIWDPCWDALGLHLVVCDDVCGVELLSDFCWILDAG